MAKYPTNTSRELLLALLGHEGDLIARIPPEPANHPDAPRFLLNRDSHLLPGDFSTITSLLPVATAVDVVSNFASLHSSALTAESLYQHALADGLNGEIDRFRRVLLDVEAQLRDDKSLPLSVVRAKLAPYMPLMPLLARFLTTVHTENLRSGALLDALSHHAESGVPFVRACFQRLLHRTAQVMFNQMSAWLFYGLLQDSSKEFFVSGVSTAAHATPSSATTVVSWLSPGSVTHGGRSGSSAGGAGAGAGAGVKAGGVEDSDGLGTGDRDDHEDDEDDDSADPEAAERDWRFRFTLDERRLPTSLVSPSVGEAIVFIGKAVRLLRHHETKTGVEALLREDDDKVILAAVETIKGPSCPSALEMEVAVDRVRTVVAARLWRLVVVEGRLLDHLASLNDYFLLARGEFFQTYIDNERADVPEPFEATATAIGVDKDPIFPRYSLFRASKEFEYPLKPLSDAKMTLVSSSIGSVAPLWHPHPVVALQGFSTSITAHVHLAAATEAGVFTRGVDLSDEMGRPDAGFSFVMHTEGARAVASGPSFGSHDALGNCLVFRFKLEGTLTDPVARVAILSGRRVAGRGCALRDLTCLGDGSRTLRIAPDGRLPITIEYTRPATKGQRGRLSVLSSVAHRLGSVGEPPAVTVDVSIEETFPLRGVRGRCWVGLAPHTAAPHGCSVDLSRWYFVSTSKADEGMDGIGLSFRVPWPLHLVISQSELDHYNELFRFMLRVRRVGMALHDAWATLMTSKRSGLWKGLQPLWLLRAKMSFVVTALQSYLQQDVVESAYTHLRELIVSSEDFEVISKAHEAFVQSLVQRSFLRKAVVSGAISEMLLECTAFTDLIARNTDDLGRCVTGEEGETLHSIESSFRGHTNFLFETQRVARSTGSGSSSLMLRLEFNGFFKGE